MTKEKINEILEIEFEKIERTFDLSDTDIQEESKYTTWLIGFTIAFIYFFFREIEFDNYKSEKIVVFLRIIQLTSFISLFFGLYTKRLHMDFGSINAQRKVAFLLQKRNIKRDLIKDSKKEEVFHKVISAHCENTHGFVLSNFHFLEIKAYTDLPDKFDRTQRSLVKNFLRQEFFFILTAFLSFLFYGYSSIS